jgi:hypothetical protein
MAIMRDSIRDAHGNMTRFHSLKDAGLLYVPVSAYKYDAYDVQGDTATLYEEDIDLADYQYNLDSDLAQVVPMGYAGVSGGTHGYWLVGLDTRLYYRHAATGVIELPFGSPTGVTMVTGDSTACLAIVGGALKGYAYAAGGVTETVIDATKAWTYISNPSSFNPGYAIGVADGQLWQVGLSPVALTILSYQVGWEAAAPGLSIFITYGNEYYWSAAIHPSGYLCWVPDNPGLALSAPLDLGAGWTAVSGYGHANDVLGTYSRMYGIRAGELNSLSGATTTIATKITEFTDWWKVVFVAPDEAVAIRRTLRA